MSHMLITLKDMPLLLKKEEVADLLRCSTRTVSRLISVGRLSTLKITDGRGSGRQLIPRAELERLLRDAA